MSNSAIMPTYYFQLPIAIAHGKGAWLWDTEGKQYLDSLSGIAVCSLGHAHPAITAAICEQANKVLHTSNTFLIPNQIKLAERLTQLSGMDQAYFCNSGTEANEAAIKLTRMYARKKNIANPIVVTMLGGFHGRTFGALSASGLERLQSGCEPILPGFIHIPYNDIQALEALRNNNNIVAVMVEPIQGDGGIATPAEDYLIKIRKICDDQDWLMVLDEIQTGIGRTGKWFAYQHYNILPDILTSAKALANGIPIGACLARGKTNNLFPPGKHGCTFGGNPFACGTALAVLETFEKENIIENCAKIGSYLLHNLKETLSEFKEVVAVRGKGLMLGVELDKPCRDILMIGLKHRLLFNVTADRVIRLLPPLIINKTEADEIVKRLRAIIKEFYQK